ncbi:hypothetical protein G7046_g2349 [Stylonectria norvegica]|nr:hypothetical protein G7046_g2349 [Stylonectria norvegica]
MVFGFGSKSSSEAPSESIKPTTHHDAEQVNGDSNGVFDGDVHVPCPAHTTDRKLISKVDLRVLPPLAIMYLLAFLGEFAYLLHEGYTTAQAGLIFILDRVNISNANVYGLSDELGLDGNKYNVALVVFFVPYVLFEIPSNLLLKHFKPRVWLSLNMCLFGFTTVMQGIVKNYPSLIATRFFLGLFETGMFPGAFYIIGMWYRRDEAQRRYSFFFNSTTLAGAFGGLLAAAIGKMAGMRNYAGWRWIFILEGCLTVVCGVGFYFWLPDFPEAVTWLTPEEKKYVAARLQVDQGRSAVERKIKFRDVINVFKDFKVVLGGFMYLGLIVPAYGYAYFAPGIIRSYGYSAIQTQLHSVPPWAAAFGFSMIVAYCSDKTRHRFGFAVFAICIAIVGFGILISVHDNTRLQYGSLFLVAMGAYTAMPIVVCWFNMNLGGHHRRAVGTAWQVGFGNIGGIIAVFAFLAKDAPKYISGYSICISFTILSILSCILYGFFCWSANKKRDQAPPSMLTEDEKTELGDMSPTYRSPDSVMKPFALSNLNKVYPADIERIDQRKIEPQISITSPIAIMKLSSCLSLISLVSSTVALSGDQWSKQSIYQVLTDRFARTDESTDASCDASAGQYCGGSFQGIIRKLDYIQGMGFSAIWISPIVANIEAPSDGLDGQAYHGFWAQDIWSINSHFGTADDLKTLSQALHDRSMYLMVDIVTNHMGYNGCGTCVDYSIYDAFSDASYFHDFCLIDYSDEWSSNLQTCWEGDNIVSLPDLRTENDNVRAIWFDWIGQIVTKYSIDGLRIDSVKHIEKSFNRPFEEAAGVYTIGEVLNGDPAFTLPFQEDMGGVLNYPMYFWLKEAFGSTSGDFSALINGIDRIKTEAVNSSLLGSFMENHDQTRWPSITSDKALNRNAIAFTILQDGIPIIYQGQEQYYSGTDQTGRAAIWLSKFDTSTAEYALISSLNQIRNQAIYKSNSYITYQAWLPYTDSSTIVMRKGSEGNQIISVLSKTGASAADKNLVLGQSVTGFTANEAVVEILGCKTLTADANGSLTVTITGGQPLVLYPKSQVVGSGICSL